jgi:hypothetical protein
MKLLSYLHRLATASSKASLDDNSGAHSSTWEEAEGAGWFTDGSAPEPARWTDAQQHEVASQNSSAVRTGSAAPRYAQKSEGVTETDYYNFEGGRIVDEHVGGSLSWRNDNPGNILFEHQSAAIGAYDSPNGYDYAIFPDYAVGVKAAVHLLESSSYAGAGLSVNAAMQRWTGLASGSATLQSYDQIVDSALRLPGSTELNSLSGRELVRLVEQGIQKAEGWITGVDDRLG